MREKRFEYISRAIYQIVMTGGLFNRLQKMSSA